MDKTYLAIVRSWPLSPQTICSPLKCLDDPSAPQDAVTELELIARIELPFCVETLPRTRYGLVALKPHSGRRHQLRRHLKHIHHPIVGDTTYGRGAHNRFFRQRLGCDRLLLHQQCLVWTDLSGEPRAVEAPLDANWMRILASFAWTARFESWRREL